MEHSRNSVTIPRSATVTLCTSYLLLFAAWLFLLNGTEPVSWPVLLGSALVAANSLFWGLSLWAVLSLALRKLPHWLTPVSALYLAVGSFVAQAAFAGILSLLGAWPHSDLWYLGATAFLWRG